MFEINVKAVESGAFPIDLLRVEEALPMTEEDSMKISMSFRSGLGSGVYAETITLRSAEKPDPQRWYLRGWAVVEVGEVNGEEQA